MDEVSNDGLYGIAYKIGHIWKSRTIGYYSNGSSIEKLIKIYFQADTLKIENVYSKY